MAAELPAAADPASPWMSHLERAHALAHAAARAIEEESEPSLHLAPAAEKLARAMVAMYDAFDGRADRTTAIGQSHARLWDAAILIARAGGLGGALEAVQEACGELIAAEERFPRVPLAGRAFPPLRAGVDAPVLHTIERASLAPSFRAPPLPEPEPELPALDLPEPTTFEELRAAAAAVRAAVAERTTALTKRADKPKKEAPPEEDVPPGFACAPPARMPEDDFVRRWARECVTEIGMIGIQRVPLLGDSFRTSLPLERRMVTALDALAALGPIAIAYVEPLVLDAPAVDPMGVFAATMIGGSFEGRDALASAERVLYRFGPGDPAVAEPFVSAMKLAQNPFTPPVLRSLLRSADPACRAIGAEVLAHRGWLTEAELAALAEDGDPRLLAVALPALAAGQHLRELYRVVPRALAHADAGVQEAALEAMALAAHPDAASAARAAVAGPLGERALVHLAIVADEADARWLLDRVHAAPTAAAIEAVGWAGLVAGVMPLIRLLETGEDDAKLAAGAALYRLLGAKIIETIEIDPEELDDPAVTDPDPDARPERRPLADVVSDKRDKPPPGSKEKLEVPSIDPEKWRAYWAEHSGRFDPRLRLRRGQAWSPSVSLYELDQLPLTPAERRRLHRELAARTGKLTAFDPHDFVVVQEQSLAAWGALVRSAVYAEGAWTRAIGV